MTSLSLSLPGKRFLVGSCPPLPIASAADAIPHCYGAALLYYTTASAEFVVSRLNAGGGGLHTRVRRPVTG